MSIAWRLLLLAPWLVHVAALTPAARTEHTLTYHTASGGAVLYGGRAAQDMVLADTWVYTTEWLRVPSPQCPGPRWGHCAAYDAQRQVVVLFGGAAEVAGAARGVSITPSAVLSDTWLFDGSAWLPVMTNTAPPARTQSAMAYDVRRGVSVLYGGLDALGRPLSDTWEFDGSAWTLAPTAHAPATGLSQAGGLYEHAMAYDPGAELLLLTGGTDGLYDTSLTWTFDGDDWRQLATTGAPYPRHGHALAFDSGRGAVLLFGGAHGLAYADVYAWTGDGWETVAGGAGAPPARAGHGLCFDALAGQALLFGGIGATSVLLGDAWGLDTLGWKLLTPVTRAFSASVPLVCR